MTVSLPHVFPVSAYVRHVARSATLLLAIRPSRVDPISTLRAD
jgi:hypothetical protein